ncbi:unnamed protein product, partial [Musa acuminata subsp. malaccensis]
MVPLDKYGRRILVAGRHADDIGCQCGGWTVSWQGSSGKTMISTTMLEGVRDAAGNETEDICDTSPSEATLCDQEFSYAVVATGEDAHAESSGDRTELGIPPFDGASTVSLVASKVPTVVIVVLRRPLVFEPELLEKIDALLPGSEGRGIADVLFGGHDFEGVRAACNLVQVSGSVARECWAHVVTDTWIEDESGQTKL